MWHIANSIGVFTTLWPSTRHFSVCEFSPHPHWNLLRIAQRRLPFGDVKLTLLVSSLLCGLLYDFFSMWVFTPIPIEICYGLLRDALHFCDMKLTLFCVSATSGLYTTFFSLWVFTPSSMKFVTGCSGMLAIMWHETNSFGATLLVSSLLRGLLHDVFQWVSVHPHPHWNLLLIAQVCVSR